MRYSIIFLAGEAQAVQSARVDANTHYDAAIKGFSEQGASGAAPINEQGDDAATHFKVFDHEGYWIGECIVVGPLKD